MKKVSSSVSSLPPPQAYALRLSSLIAHYLLVGPKHVLQFLHDLKLAGHEFWDFFTNDVSKPAPAKAIFLSAICCGEWLNIILGQNDFGLLGKKFLGFCPRYI